MAQHKIAILLHDEFEMWRPPPWFLDRLRTEFPQIEVAYSSSKRHDEAALRGVGNLVNENPKPQGPSGLLARLRMRVLA